VAKPKVFVSPVPDFMGQKEDDGDYESSVLVALNVNHERGLQNVYRVDDGPWTPYREPFVIAKKGLHTVVFRTLDKAGNVLAEAARLVTIEHGRDHGREHDHDHCSDR